MTGYTPAQMPVLSALARGFATFDHWFCEVPSQTFCNRSFFHAGTSLGYVVNMSPIDSFPVHNTAETIFDPMPIPLVDRGLIMAEVPFEILEHPEIRERMDVAGDQ